ncbi:protein daughter of sevenless isoform X2 [Schistocerca piceifrons]|uniref:protein daughter of sevenless isoform X2 n=1 Tax=Schistocerca piceifrons TaxID=274613 RepID=UPI001F5EBA53|nr:protein daughter of sevenless isoform X2 [Schistocerca piceifrons]
MTDMSSNSLEIVHEGWLIKSPPTKPIWRADLFGRRSVQRSCRVVYVAPMYFPSGGLPPAEQPSKYLHCATRWRRRWFVLRHSGELPGQYFLEYYADRNRRKLKGKIDLDQCERVDAGLSFENRKVKYHYMFDVQTPKRTYYLAADSEEDMNKWVECVCQVCGLKAYQDDDVDVEEAADAVQLPMLLVAADGGGAAAVECVPEMRGSATNISATNTSTSATDSPPVSPVSTVSGPYIAISECISGHPLTGPEDNLDELLQRDTHIFMTRAHYGLVNTEYGTAVHQARSVKGKEPEPSSVKPTIVLQKAPVPAARKRQVYEEAPPPEVVTGEFYDLPRKLHPPNLDLQQSSGTGLGTPPHSPNTDGESVFTDDDTVGPGHGTTRSLPSVNWETFPSSAEADTMSLPRTTRPSDSSTEGDVGSWSVVRRFGRLTVVDSDIPPPAPPRPPKPSHLTSVDNSAGPSYMNLDNISSQSTGSTVVNSDKGSQEPPSPVSPPHTDVIVVTDDMYDFPRSHQYPVTAGLVSGGEADGTGSLSRMPSLSRHCYSNAAPVQVNGDVFRYDFHDDVVNVPLQDGTIGDEPPSPQSEGSCSGSVASSSTAAAYSNLPSPSPLGQVPTPPAVDRGLKPGRKLSDTLSIASNELSPGAYPAPPSVDRKLKPNRRFKDIVIAVPETGVLNLASPPACRPVMDGSRSLRRTRAAPSPTPPSTTAPQLLNGQRQRSDYNTSSDEDNRSSFDDDQISRLRHRLPEIQYLDLDLDSDTSGMHSAHLPRSPERPVCTGTVYKTIDFVKTEALNHTRQHMEEERRRCPFEL